MDRETARIGIAAAPIAIIAASAKIGRNDQDKEQFMCLEGYLLIVCLLSEEVTAKGS